MKNKKIVSIFAFVFVIASIFFLSGCLKDRNPINYNIGLEVWGLIDDSDAFKEINENYKRINPQIKNIQYKKVSSNVEEFERELLNAIASGKGPDVIFFHNSWLLEHAEKVAPYPQSNQYLGQFNKTFIDVATTDFIKDDNIYAMPLHSDTLALFYNKDIFNQQSIVKAPETWEELTKYVEKNTTIDQAGNISRSAVALGRSNNPGGINRASDIITLLFMQNGLDLNNDNNYSVGFDQSASSISVLDFYTSFAKNSPLYTWNSKMDYSVDSFRFGKTAMMINYSYMANRLKNTDPKLNFEVAPMPQFDLENKVNYVNYWGLAVIKNKALIPDNPNQPINYTNEDRVKEAWKYIKYVTTGKLTNKEGQEITATPDPTELYLNNTKKPAARKDLIDKQKNDPLLGVFATQALTAKSWQRPVELKTDVIFNEMIDSVVSGKSTTREAVQAAARKLNILLKELKK